MKVTEGTHESNRGETHHMKLTGRTHDNNRG